MCEGCELMDEIDEIDGVAGQRFVDLVCFVVSSVNHKRRRTHKNCGFGQGGFCGPPRRIQALAAVLPLRIRSCRWRNFAVLSRQYRTCSSSDRSASFFSISACPRCIMSTQSNGLFFMFNDLRWRADAYGSVMMENVDGIIQGNSACRQCNTVG